MRFFFACLILAALGIVTGAAEPAQMIVKDGKANAQIVIAAENRPRMTTLAALELRKYVEKISGARLPIVTTPDAAMPVKIYVGKSPDTEKLGVKDEGLQYGAFKIASGKDLSATAGWIALVGNDRDFVPTKLTSMSKKDPAPVEEWKKLTAGKTDGAWTFPGGGDYKNYWNPKDFDKVMDDYYGEGSAALWKTGGNKGTGFWHGDVAGSVSAVAEFLYGLGVRFYMPDDEIGTVIPRLASIPVPEINKTFVPSFPCRYWFWYNYGTFPLGDVLWARRLGINEGSGYYTGVHGLTVVYSSPEMKKAHSEYYALVGGKRDTEHRNIGVVCYSSDGFFRETVNYCRFMFDVIGAKTVDIMPGDGLKQCQCDGCKVKTPSQMVWEFVNRVATELYKTNPDNIVNCGAYTSYRDAPDSIGKFSPNVMVSIYNYIRPAFMDPDNWANYQKNIEKWRSKLAPGRIRRGENNLQNGSPAPERRQLIGFPIIFPRAMARDLKYLKGISLGEGAECPQIPGKWKAPGVDHLALYLQARYLMDADQDTDKVLDEYYTTFYGPAAKEMREAFTYAEDNIATKDKSKSDGKADITNVPVEAKVKIRELLQKAKLAAGDGIYGQRVAKIIAELKTKEQVIAEDQGKKAIIAERIKKAPLAIGVEGADLSKAQEYLLKERSGGDAKFPTTFKVGWDKDALLFDILCKEPDMKNVVVSDPVYDGDYVAVALETPLYSPSPYLLHISPAGKILDGNSSFGRWASHAEVNVEKGDDFWRLKIRIPVVGAEEAGADANNYVAGEKPTAENPWFFMVGRSRVRGGSSELQSSNIIPKVEGWKSTKAYGKLEIK